jgi:cytochrome c-type biogenesis protein CcmH/NrfG
MNNTTETDIVPTNQNSTDALTAPAPLTLVGVPARTQVLLLRMFADPRVLAKEEKAEIVKQLRECVALHPNDSTLRVVFGMALCVNLDVQQAMEELGEAVALDPNSFIAHMKMAELWMRLRVCTKAQDHTHHAAMLAQNMAQAEMARRQAITLRTMLREGIERDGYRIPWFSIARVRRFWNRNRNKADALATVDIV